MDYLDYPTDKQEQERELARIYWQIQDKRNELKALEFSGEGIRRRAKRQLVKWVIGISFTTVALWFVGQTVFFFLH